MKKTLLIGNFGDYNLGDELILDAALDMYGTEKVVVMTVDSDFSQEFCGKLFETMPPFPTGFRSFLNFIFSAAYRKALFKNRGNIDRVVFVGGGLFAIRLKAYFIWWAMSCWTKKLFKNVPIHWEYQGIDMPKIFLGRYFLMNALKGSHNISVRDEKSLEVLESLGLYEGFEVREDRVFESLQSLKPSSRPEEEELNKDILLLNAINPITDKDWVRVQELAGQKNLEVVFVAFTLSDTQNIPWHFQGAIKFPETKKILFLLCSQAKVFIGERFHALILGQHFCPNATFVLRSPYSRKVENFCGKHDIKQLS